MIPKLRLDYTKNSVYFLFDKRARETLVSSRVLRPRSTGRKTPTRVQAMECLTANLIVAVQLTKTYGVPCRVKTYKTKKYFTKKRCKFSVDDLTWAQDLLVKEGLVVYVRGQQHVGCSKLVPTDRFTRLLPSKLINNNIQLASPSKVDEAYISDNTKLINKNNLSHEYCINLLDSFLASSLRPPASQRTPLLPNQLKTLIKSKNLQYYRKVKNSDFGQEGRFVCLSGLQRLSKAMRATMTIDGDDVVERDYSGTHLRIMYGQVGAECTEDPYAVFGEDRATIKKVFLIFLNSPSETTFKQKVQQELNRKRFTLVASLDDLVKLFRNKHPLISKWFLTSQNAQDLQCIEARIAEYIMMRFVAWAKPIHCIHDSFIVKKSDERLLISTMEEAWKHVMREINPAFNHVCPPIS